jgi:hypothetical protein
MAASHDALAMACGDRQAGCDDGEAQSESDVETPSTSGITPHTLLALLRRAHIRQVIFWTVASALYPIDGS